MKKILVLAACAALLFAGAAQADTLTLGNHYTAISFVENGVSKTLGGGSFDTATWTETGGTPTTLSFIYCVDLGHNISLNGVYGSATATSNGFVNGAGIRNAGQIAWLLDHYGTGGNLTGAYALQAAIWHVIYDTGSDAYRIGASAPSAAVTLYNEMLAALSLSTGAGNISNYLWITPRGTNDVQGQVASVHPVPEPGTMVLLGSGLVGLAGWGRKRFRK